MLISIRDMQCVKVDGEGDILALCQVPGKGELGLGGRCLSKRGEGWLWERLPSCRFSFGGRSVQVSWGFGLGSMGESVVLLGGG